MRILVLGVYYSNNLGDGVICQCVADRLKKHFPAAEIVIEDILDRHDFVPHEGAGIEELSKRRFRLKLRYAATKYFAWDKQLKSTEGLLAQNRKHLKTVLSEKWDAVVIAGGQLFMDKYTLFLETVIQKCEEGNIPVFINACGTGPTVSKTIRMRFTEIVKSPYLKFISSRDDVEQLKTLYKIDEVVSSFDPALWTKEVYETDKDEMSQTIGLGIMYAESRPMKAMVEVWRNIIREMERKQMNWKVFVNGSGDDVSFAKYVLEQIPELQEAPEAYMVKRPETPEELVNTIAHFKSIISFRLHSHIIAASLGIPSVALVWDNKLNFFFDKINCGWRCCTIFDQTEEILEKLARAEKEGLDMELIKEQKQFAENLLITAMEKGINKNE